MAHEYVSVYCHHGKHDRCAKRGFELNAAFYPMAERKDLMHCKECDAPCRCACHYAIETRSGTGEISVQEKVEAVDRYAQEHQFYHCPNCQSSMSFVSDLPGGERLMQCRECGRVVAINR